MAELRMRTHKPPENAKQRKKSVLATLKRLFSQQENVSQQESIVEALKRNGFPNLDRVNFINVRLTHGNAEDARVAVDAIEQLKPDIILLEGAGFTGEEVAILQECIDGSATFQNDNKFLKTLIKLLRKSEPKKQPLILVNTDCRHGTIDLSELDCTTFSLASLLQSIRLGNVNFETAKALFADVRALNSTAQRRREDAIVNNFVTEFLKHKYAHKLKDKKEITIVAPFGASHGRLSVLFRELGAHTSAVPQMSSTPSVALILREYCSDSDIENSILSFLLESHLEKEIGKRGMDFRLLIGPCSWYAINSLRKKYGDGESVYNTLLEWRRNDECLKKEIASIVDDFIRKRENHIKRNQPGNT